MSLKIILADDHSLYLQGLMLLLKESENFEVLGNANSGKDAIE